MAGWTYLILSERGEVYLGATTHLRNRLRWHNSLENDGWTRGRRWHLLDFREFPTIKEAFLYEAMLKKKPHQKIKWKLATIPQAQKIQRKYGYDFDPLTWLIRHSRGTKRLPEPQIQSQGLRSNWAAKEG